MIRSLVWFFAVWVSAFSVSLAEPRPPVILVDGWYPKCATAPRSSASTFGQLESKLNSLGITTEYFRPCSVPAQPGFARATIEELGQALGALIEQTIQRTGASQVDVIAFSVGSLTLRAYLTGKQNAPGVFQPPADHKIRKAVFLGGVFFGSSNNGVPAVPDPQDDALNTGTPFQWDINTWNQGGGELRGIDAIAVAGSGKATEAGSLMSDGDGVSSLTSASLSFAYPAERTRIIEACHVSDICRPTVSSVYSDSHPTWLIVRSFLAGTDEWKTVGSSPDKNTTQTENGGIFVGVKDASDNLIVTTSVSLGGTVLDRGGPALFYLDRVAKGQYTLQATAGIPAPDLVFSPTPGTYSMVTMKPGPIIARAIPSAGLVETLSLAPGSFVSVYGTRLGTGTHVAASLPLPTTLGETTVTVNDQPIGLHFAAENQLNAVLPENASGLVKMTVKTGEGIHSINLLIEEAVPAVFTLLQTGSGPAAALHAVEGGLVNDDNAARVGEYVSVYLTGLGATEASGGLQVAKIKPEATVDGIAATVAWAGRAPGFVGLDQVNIIIPAGVREGTSVPLIIRSGKRVSNTTTLAIR